MRFELVSILEQLRSVYLLPPGPDRFQAYLETVVGGAERAKDVNFPPLVMANPMAKDHVLAVVDRWIALGAEDAARSTVAEANVRLESVAYTPTVKVGLTVLDDLEGGWTNRTISDAVRFETGISLKKTGWITVCLWASDVPSLLELRQNVLEAAKRATLATLHGDPLTLGAMMRQEGVAAAFAERTVGFGPEEIEYSRTVLQPYLESTHQPTIMAAMYGDDGARAWGYKPLGLSKNAGFQVGLEGVLKSHSETLI